MKLGTRTLNGSTLAAGGLIACLLVGGVVTVLAARHPDETVSPAGLGTIGGPFNLLDGAGKAVTQADFRGRYLLVYFGYTYCPDVCPATLTSVAAALDRLGPRADQLRAVFVTVDPKRDTPDIVRSYAAAFSPAITGLTGSPAQIADMAREFRVYFAEHRTGPGPNDYTVDHSSMLYLMGPDGAFLSLIRADGGPEVIAAELERRLPST